MKRPFLALLLVALPALAQAETTFSKNATEAMRDLREGSVVIIEQNGSDAPETSTAGRLEPAGVPPEKIIFEIGSISKIFTGILLAQAVMEKKVTLSTTLREVMGARQRFADPNVASITLEHLATHTSGLPRLPTNIFIGADDLDPYAHYDRTKLDAYLAKAKLDHAPPFASEYSNLGVGLLGDLLSRLYGQSWEQLCIERITKPLGLVDTCITLNAEQKKRLTPPYAGKRKVKLWEFKALAGAGALRSTAADMHKFAQALNAPASTPLKEAIEMIETPRADGDIGLCLAILKLEGGVAYWFQGGTGGYCSWISARPFDGRIVTVLINNSDLSPETVFTGKP
jgi:serine-type D-Ala-D-Ala carboxypeptidase/endopeptidase